ncbi:type II secretion system F family protein [Streptomyces sp. HNM0663]|uniref:Type II secretion system F family protein n=1 Tax=Streptomyces chengmaiensis TaxID=3040919 RepID=A0ABT6HHC2_9ACTN|nr:type II secretion system F family protein [Streptomyces chengmaiensis]MDH2387692.1 type II secretion system F family protein [Streptomyces chengmaiensis]
MSVGTVGVPLDPARLDALRGLAVPASALAALALLALMASAHRRERRTRNRAEALLAARGGQQAGRRRRWRVPAVWARGWAGPLGALVAGWVLIGGVAGASAGLAAAYAVRRWQSARAKDSTRAAADGMDGAGGADAREAMWQLPLAADLLAACLSAGAAPRDAAEAVGEALSGPVGGRLVRTAAELRLGGEPAGAWARFGRIPGAEPLARCLERADRTGAPAAGPVARLADRLRADQARLVTARGRKAQVLITAPVGLCFLPAFLAVGVAPVVIGLADGLLGGG